MSARFIIVTTLTLFINLLNSGNSSRILAVCPTPTMSHQVVFQSLALALNKRGHEIVFVTTISADDPDLKNFTEIDIRHLYENKSDVNMINVRGKIKWFDIFTKLGDVFHNEVDKILSQEELKKIYAADSGEKFDVILLEMFYWPAFYAFAQRFDAPIIGISTLGLTTNIQYAIGNPIIPSHPSQWEISSKESDVLTFWQRLEDFVDTWKHLYYYKNNYIIGQEAVAKKHFGYDMPSLSEIEKNISLIFVNRHGPISYSKPSVPNVIEIGNFHVNKETEYLPKHLQKTLDEATQGFVYMSLGSNIKSYMLSDKLRAEFITAFSKLPYKVLWKFDNDTLPDKPDNVIIMKWTPQQAILAHPNLKVFIYQGGLQSTEEAVKNVVPLIGLPVMADQDIQVNKLVSLGVAIKLEITRIKSEELIDAIRTVVLDKSYKQRMLNLRSLLQDKSQDPLENAIWWTEHVIRHRGAPYLRSTTADDPWYQRQDMDIIAFLTAVSAMVLNLLLIILYKILTKCKRTQVVQSSNKKLKIT